MTCEEQARFWELIDHLREKAMCSLGFDHSEWLELERLATGFAGLNPKLRKQGTLKEAFQALAKASGGAFDNLDVDEFMREIRGE